MQRGTRNTCADAMSAHPKRRAVKFQTRIRLQTTRAQPDCFQTRFKGVSKAVLENSIFEIRKISRARRSDIRRFQRSDSGSRHARTQLDFAGERKCNPEPNRDNDVPRCGAVIPDMRNQIPLCAPRVPAIAGAIPVGGNRIPHDDNAIPDNDNDLPVIAAWRAITPLFRAANSLLELAGKRSASIGKILGVPAISAACGVKFPEIPADFPVSRE